MTKWTRLLYQPNLPLDKNGARITACKEHITLSKNAAKEGMVLLKNKENLLPFSEGAKLALFGKGSFDYVKGGGGSGDVTVAYTVNLDEGLRSAGCGIQLQEDLADFYRTYVRDQYALGNEPGMIPEPELPDYLYEKARWFTDTAVIAISRFSGESWDRSVTDDAMEKTAASRLAGKSGSLFERGDFYLSRAEAAMVENVKRYFPKIAVVLNVGGMVDTQWFFEDDRIQSVLMAWQGGMEGGRAAAELLCGMGNPSGKLSDTFAKKLEDYPSSADFHKSTEYVDYTEDIYVGYRYFETIPGAASAVNYPFGFGLSYTTFEQTVVSVREKNGQITIQICVKNTGKLAGKEVVQVYACAPQGCLGKAARSLVSFQKTKLLQPREVETLHLQFSTSSMASYDDLGKVAKSAYILEAGTYQFHVGTSVRDTTLLNYEFYVPKDTVVEQLSPKLVPTSLCHRMLADGSYEKLPMGVANDPDFSELEPMDSDARLIGEVPAVRAVGRHLRKGYTPGIHFRDVAEGTMELDEFVSRLSDAELAHLLGGQPNIGVANTWGFGNMPEYGIPNAMTADGPAGLRIKPECGINTTAFPCATLLACTWDPDLLYAVGQAGAREVKENNLAVWLTPAVNIHRSPLCGRNFEYYSEDPYLTGILAASMVRGIQSQNICAAVKHFALNNKETNRKNSDSRVSERAAREIYLKAFEIIVKTAAPWYVMSAYNIINGHRASENRELLEDILRAEWGFNGIVSTDWWTFGEHYKEVKAGNDLKMATGYPERLLMALDSNVLSREEMETCAKRILKLLLKFD